MNLKPIQIRRLLRAARLLPTTNINTPQELQQHSYREFTSVPVVTNHCRVRRQRQECNHLIHPKQRCYASASNAFWRELNQAVQQGNGMHAEEMVKSLLLLTNNNNGTHASSPRMQPRQEQEPIDTRLFSLVLQAWKNNKDSPAPDPNAARRAHKLLEEMTSLARDGILTEEPTLDDYHAVLESWYHQAHFLPPSQSIECVEQILSFVTSPTTTTYELALSILGKGGHAKEALQSLRELRNKYPEIEPTLNMYNSILQAYSLQGAPGPALKLFKSMQAQTTGGLPCPNGDSYNAVIACCCAQPTNDIETGVQHAQDLLDQMKAHKVQRTLESYTPVISALAKLGEAKQAEVLLTRLVQDYGFQFDANLKPSLQPFQSVLWAYSKSYHPDAAKRAQALLNNMRELYDAQVLKTEPNIMSYNIVLKCWAQSKSKNAPKQVTDLYEEMRSSNMIPDSTSMNTVLNTWATKTAPDKTEALFWKFYRSYVQDPLHNPQPNVISFGTVLKAWASKSFNDPTAPDRAEALFRKLFELHQSGWEQCKPDAVTFASLIQCWGKSKQRGAAEKAESLLRKMQQLAKEGETEMAPDTICWNSAIQAWAQAGNGERAEALFKEMLVNYIRDRNERQKPNVITFTAVLSAWAKTRFYKHAPKRAEKILEQMEKLHQSGALDDVKPNCVSYSILLDCLAYAKKNSSAAKAESILNQMKQSDDRDLQPNVISYNSVIKAWSFTRDAQAVAKVTALLEELLEKSEADPRMTPNSNTFGSVLKTIGDSRLPDKGQRAESVVNLMGKYRVPINDWSRNQLQRCQNDQGNAPSERQSKLELPEIPALKYS
jgi:pentatricopeptide repeat protein